MLDVTEEPPAGGEEHFGSEAWSQLLRYSELLENEGEERGLIGPRERKRLWSRHILNSTAVVDYIPDGARVGDVGSGAGFPGIVIAILRPESRVTLIESMERRCAWLRDVAVELKLSNVSVRHTRSEELKGRFVADVVTARAVAQLKKLIPLTFPLICQGGALLALKGERVDAEISAAVGQLEKYRADWADVYGVVPFGCEEETYVLKVQKKQ
ncbi:MAG: 16S rRNA (guanine(527)-N(7))-methyltransferase RsmG [Ancrocorticia sp.]|jgi:16S rRNA (guanine527-N7)-methyltransferase|nr:16S rRNA (guanine(527)-N(7))-methyltransferase RsmG [Ancrocorticia sp.]MCI2193839.1 16S rRNA (guanine(527)-N(7))-methyltransferase RsmG [Ancrocorticia sp.]MCI2198664.1 16S rRNA (guanine(527)-N(7))-methyltransferase RsmG [Ancrocorticia sp.]